MAENKKYSVYVSVARNIPHYGDIDLIRYILDSSSEELAEKKALTMAKEHYPEYDIFRIFDTEEVKGGI